MSPGHLPSDNHRCTFDIKFWELQGLYIMGTRHCPPMINTCLYWPSIGDHHYVRTFYIVYAWPIDLRRWVSIEATLASIRPTCACTVNQCDSLSDNMFERLVAGYHHHIDADDRSVVTPFGVAFAMDKLFGANMAATLATTAAKIQKLQLTSEERGLLMAFVTITPGQLEKANRFSFF